MTTTLPQAEELLNVERRVFDACRAAADLTRSPILSEVAVSLEQYLEDVAGDLRYMYRKYGHQQKQQDFSAVPRFTGKFRYSKDLAAEPVTIAQLRGCRQLNNILASQLARQNLPESEVRTTRLEADIATLRATIVNGHAEDESNHYTYEPKESLAASISNGVELPTHDYLSGYDSFDDQDCRSQPEPEFEESWDEHQPGILETLHLLSLEGLEIIAEDLRSIEMSHVASRLRIWAVGLLRGPSSLDNLLVADHETPLSPKTLGYSMVARSFLRMLLIIEQILLSLETEHATSLYHLEQTSWVFEDETMQDEARTLASFMADLEEIALAEDCVEICCATLYEEVEGLYNISPAIRTMRSLQYDGVGTAQQAVAVPVQTVNSSGEW